MAGLWRLSVSAGASSSVAAATRQANADIAIQLGATYGWRADNATGASTTSSIPSYIGSLVCAPGGTEKALPSADSLLNNQKSIASFGGVGYAASLAIPSTLTMLVVGRWSSGSSSGLSSFTVGGAVNSGASLFYQSGVGAIARKAGVATATDSSVAATQAAVMLGVFDTSGVTLYSSKKTGISASAAGALAGDQIRLMDLSSGGIFGVVGAWARTVIWNRALTTLEIGNVLDFYGALYGVTIGV